MCDNPHCGQLRLFIEMAPRNEIVSASLLQRVSPLYSTFQPYVRSTTKETRGTLRLLRATDQLQEPEEVLSGSPAYLERKSEPPNAREDCHLGEVRADRSKLPVKAAADHTGMGMVSRT